MGKSETKKANEAADATDRSDSKARKEARRARKLEKALKKENTDVSATDLMFDEAQQLSHKKPFSMAERFSRIGAITPEIEKANPAKERTQTASGYGARAAADFDGIRGKDFTKAKNKKKRGSYHGGQIDAFQSNSTKFVYSDDEL